MSDTGAANGAMRGSRCSAHRRPPNMPICAPSLTIDSERGASVHGLNAPTAEPNTLHSAVRTNHREERADGGWAFGRTLSDARSRRGMHRSSGAGLFAPFTLPCIRIVVRSPCVNREAKGSTDGSVVRGAAQHRSQRQRRHICAREQMRACLEQQGQRRSSHRGAGSICPWSAARRATC